MVPSLLLEALDSGDVALVTDAGSPGISDPGAGVVAAVADAGYDVVSVPGDIGGVCGAVRRWPTGSNCLNTCFGTLDSE